MIDKHGYRPHPPLLAGHIVCGDVGLRARLRAIELMPTWDQIALANYLLWKKGGLGGSFVHNAPRPADRSCDNCPVCGGTASPDGSEVCKCDSCGHRW